MPRGDRAQTRRRLLDAARAVVADKGFRAASVDAIAARAGFSVGALYSNFAGKDELFLALFDEHLAWFGRTLAEAPIEPGEPAAPPDWLDDVLSDSEQFLVFFEFWAYAVRTPSIRDDFAERLAELRAKVATRLREAGAGDASDGLALAVLALGRGLALERLADPRAVPDGFLAAAIDGFLQGRSAQRGAGVPRPVP